MTVYFRPCGDPCLAPVSRSERDDALRARIAAATGFDIQVSPDVDYEDWTEPMTLLDAAIEKGVEIAILSRGALDAAMDAPVLRIEGTPCPDILIGRQARLDGLHLADAGLSWPPKADSMANHYGELAAFHAAAGRRTVLADMAGDPEMSNTRDMIGKVSSIPLGQALAAHAGGTCFVKQVFPAKELPPLFLEIPQAACAAEAEQAFISAVGFHFARFEGEPGALLVQDIVEMTHETRFFVIDGTVVCGAACIEDHTPLENTDGDRLRPVFEIHRNGGDIVHDQAAAAKLLAAAERVTADILSEQPALQHFVLDLALGADGQPIAIEMNPIGASGLYGISAGRLVGAILAMAGK